MIKRRIRQVMARMFWAIGDGFAGIGDRINLIDVKRAPPSEVNKILYATLEAKSEKFVSSVTRSNALTDTTIVGGIDHNPCPWWRR